MIKGIVSEIQRSSFNDGPGIRTTVFLKGCPLNCRWCHNPESISREPTILFYPKKCIGCKMCEHGCFSGAKKIVGKEMTTAEVMEELLIDLPYYGESGGVTFTGGEPQMQPEFLQDLLLNCKSKGIKTAIETSMIYFYPDVLKNVDLIYADFKIWDNEKHCKYIGVGNEKIKQNIILADELGVPIIIHTPIIPTVNADKFNIENIKNFAKGLKNCIGYELLPYHPLGIDKAAAMGIKQEKFPVPNQQLMEELKSYAYLQR